MASRSPPTMRARLAPAKDGVLPTDELEEVLLWLPSKPLGRLRTICRSWRSMISAPHFVAAHAARCKVDSLLVAAVYDAADVSRVDLRLVDMASGAVVSRLDGQGNGHLGASGGLICLVGTGDRAAVRVLNPATGAVASIPGHTTAHGEHTRSSYVFGQVATTSEYKVLRIYTAEDKPGQSCEILALGGRGDHGQRWRPAQSPPVPVGTTISRHRVVTQGVAHFLTSHMAECDGIASFDLETEEWRPTLLGGPLSSQGRHCSRSDLSLVELNGCLVTVHHDYRAYSIDMWLLTDLEKGTWSRTHSLDLSSVLRGGETLAQPLMVLDDGRIALWVTVPNGAVRVYDPRTGGCKEVAGMGKSCSVVGLYTGSLLGFI